MNMKNKILRHDRKMLSVMAVLFSAFLLGGVSQALAHDAYQDQNGYRDQNGSYQHYGYHHNHRGYWHENNGVRLWINVG
jgi:hypothetical protein